MPVDIGVPEGQEERQTLVSLVQKRARLSSAYVGPDQKEWIRMYQLYYKIRDAIYDTDEPDIKLSYAFALVEDAISRITEPILQTRPPCKVQAKRKEHDKKAEVFAAIARAYYSRPQYHIELTEANKELVITGNSWEIDEWAQEYAIGRRWAKVKKQSVMQQIVSYAGKVLPINVPVEHEEYEEVEAEYPVRVGFSSKFPSVFDCFPEPNEKRIKNMHWWMYQERSVAVDDLRNQFYIDPATGEKKLLYDLTELDNHYGPHDPGSIQPALPEQYFATTDYGTQLKNLLNENPTATSSDNLDMDRVHLMHCFEKNKIYTVANGLFVVKVVHFPYHLPWIPIRLRTYTPMKEKLHGWGILRPVEDELGQLDDIHTLSMMNFVRLVNKMVAYHADMVPFPDDFRPRAGGKIRIQKTDNVGAAIMPIDQANVVGDMLPMESNAKGLIERTTAIADYSPGSEGTKQTHKTLGGLIEIQNALAKRMNTILRLRQSDYQDQMFNMERMFSQFQFEKVPIPFFGPNGEMTVMDASREDIDTDGVGFDYLIEEDPAFGDDAIARNQAMVFVEQGMNYERFRLEIKPINPDLSACKVDKLFIQMAKKFGYLDVSSIMGPPNDVSSPEQEFQSILRGIPIEPDGNADLVKHYIWHIAKTNSPEYQKMIETGLVSPKAQFIHKNFIEALGQAVQLALQQPMEVAQAKEQAQIEVNGPAITQEVANA